MRHVRFRRGERIIVRLARFSDKIRVEVHDPGGGFDGYSPELPTRDSTSGRGLPIVAAIVDHWGACAERRGCVWFEIDRPAGDELIPSLQGEGSMRRSMMTDPS